MWQEKISNGRLKIIVRPNSAKTEITKWDSDRDSLRINVAAIPEKDKANKEVVKFFSKLLKKKVEIVSGSSSRQKVLKIY
ncbi:YggU family protein [Candidatus Woesearchaeota archaeon]|jgi:uncharacterized protein|nr:YggU family protein [Candidatus Woesearchaeota archaeon]MBT6519225.1 YggU family protein [Candidatus Woesearchaeota archaeon]MBT7367504.1 YggU family protein [Candidatus Woesearchaeota archaeon]